MTLPANNLALSQVNTELGRSSTATIELNDSGVRTLAGVGGGGTTIGMNSLLSKTHTFTASFSGGVNINLRTTAVNLGWDQVAVLNITNNGTISSASTGSFACFIGDGGFARGCTFTNNAWIVGRGGDGGYGSGPGPIDRTPATSYGLHGGGGGSSGHALGVGQPVTIVNNSAIFSGGGGGGGGGTGKVTTLNIYGLQYGQAAAGGGGGAGRGGGNGGGTGHATNHNGPGPNYHNYGAAGGGGSDVNNPGAGGNHAAVGYADIYGVRFAAVGGHGGAGGGAGSSGAGGGSGYIGGNHVSENLSSYGGGGGGPGFAVYGTSAGIISWGGYGTVHGPVHNV